MDEEKGEKVKQGFLSFLRGFGVEVIVILGIGIIIFGALVYFDVVKLGQFFERSVTLNDGTEVDIKARSEIPGYELEIKDKKGLVELVDSWGGWNREYNGIYYGEGSTAGEPLKEIEVVLIGQEQKVEKLGTSESEIDSSSYSYIEPGKITLFIHQSNKNLNRNDVDPSVFVFGQFVQNLYKSSFIITKEEEREVREENLKKIFLSEGDKSFEYFQIVRK